MDGPLPAIIIVGDSNHFAPSVDPDPKKDPRPQLQKRAYLLATICCLVRYITRGASQNLRQFVPMAFR